MIARTLRHSSVLWTIPLLLTACGSEPGTAEPDVASDDTPQQPAEKPATDGDAGSDHGEPCEGERPNAAAVCVKRARGRVLNTEGEAPPAETLVSLCGPICFAGASDSDGDFVIEVGQWLHLTEYSSLLHGRPTYAGFYFQAPTMVEDNELVLGELTVFPMPPSGDPFPQSTEADAVELSSAGVTLTVPAGLTTKFDFDALVHGGSAQEFRALELSAEQAAPALPGAPAAVTYYALSPFEVTTYATGDETRARVKLPVRLPNPTALPAGSAVELLALGSYLFADFVTPARFEVAARATVSDDGEHIDTNAGEGLELLTWVAVRPL